MRLEKATDGVHKWVAIFDDGTKTKFGAAGFDDYTITHDFGQRVRYRERHEKDLKTGDPQRAGYLSYYILWGESTSLAKNLADYKRRFKV
jgi:hypothetical protein